MIYPYKHGQAKAHRREYNIWCAMMSRCNNPNDAAYHNYGGRGIRVCDRWKDVTLFIVDIGTRPSSLHTLERLDNNGDYTPDNCCWATRKTQARNKRTNRLLTVSGVSRPLSAWSEIQKIHKNTIRERLFRGWCETDAVMLTKRKNQYA